MRTWMVIVSAVIDGVELAIGPLTRVAAERFLQQRIASYPGATAEIVTLIGPADVDAEIARRQQLTRETAALMGIPVPVAPSRARCVVCGDVHTLIELVAGQGGPMVLPIHRVPMWNDDPSSQCDGSLTRRHEAPDVIPDAPRPRLSAVRSVYEERGMGPNLGEPC